MYIKPSKLYTLCTNFQCIRFFCVVRELYVQIGCKKNYTEATTQLLIQGNRQQHVPYFNVHCQKPITSHILNKCGQTY